MALLLFFVRNVQKIPRHEKRLPQSNQQKVSSCGVGDNGLHKTSKGMREMNYQNTTRFERATMLKLPTKAFIGFMRCYRQLFPKVKFVDEIPQWIISSDIAAYHPYTKTIWIRNNLGWKKTILILLHELTHWFIHVFLNNNELYHNKIDKK